MAWACQASWAACAVVYAVGAGECRTCWDGLPCDCHGVQSTVRRLPPCPVPPPTLRRVAWRPPASLHHHHHVVYLSGQPPTHPLIFTQAFLGAINSTSSSSKSQSLQRPSLTRHGPGSTALHGFYVAH
eukprot:357652-Chlamydomonas_euryale.AAC.3